MTVAAQLRPSWRYVIPLACVLCCAPGTVDAQLPERFTNLRVLPSSISPDSLLTVMGGFTRALGVRCSHCHVARNGVRPAADEFAADDLEPKRVARAMLRMVDAVNGEHLPATGRDLVQLARVTCATCHRGIPRPVPLEDELWAVYTRRGLDSTVALYRTLRARHHGSGAYDFSELPLPTLVDRVATSTRGQTDALVLMRLNLEYHPQSWFTYQQLGQLQAAMGDTAAAIASVERGLALNPQRPFLRELLDRLRKR
ncbi:MAG: c-type cytochrome [Gemmatimonadota bacterium]